MDEKQQESTNMSWGMPRGLYQQVKYYGIPLLKAGFVAMTFIMGLQLSGSVFPVDQPIQFILCLILMTSLAFFWSYLHRRVERMRWPLSIFM